MVLFRSYSLLVVTQRSNTASAAAKKQQIKFGNSLKDIRFRVLDACRISNNKALHSNLLQPLAVGWANKCIHSHDSKHLIVIQLKESSIHIGESRPCSCVLSLIWTTPEVKTSSINKEINYIRKHSMHPIYCTCPHLRTWHFLDHPPKWSHLTTRWAKGFLPLLRVDDCKDNIPVIYMQERAENTE